MTIGIETILTNVATFLSTIAPHISLILLILSGIIYGLAQTQPPEIRGKWQTTAVSVLIGGLIVAAIAGAAPAIQQVASGALT